MSDRGWRFCGNGQSVEKLRQSARQRHPRHAFLFGGPPSLGKRTLATRFAQSLLCQQPNDIDPCFECGNCRRVLRGMHPDVTTFSLARQNDTNERGRAGTLTIETARAITSQAPLRPLNGDWRFVIVDDAELLLPDAQEALLKTIEEPPPFMVLILVSTDVEAMLPTVRSRCEALDFGAAPIGEIERFLRETGIVPEIAQAAAAFSFGAPGWAIRASQDPAMIDESASVVQQAADWIASSEFDRIATAFSISDRYARQRSEAVPVIEATAGLWRDSVLVRTGNSDRIVFRAHVNLTDRLAGSNDIAELHGALSAVWTCLEDLRINVRPRLALESMVLSWPNIPTQP